MDFVTAAFFSLVGLGLGMAFWIGLRSDTERQEKREEQEKLNLIIASEWRRYHYPIPMEYDSDHNPKPIDSYWKARNGFKTDLYNPIPATVYHGPLYSEADVLVTPAEFIERINDADSQ